MKCSCLNTQCSFGETEYENITDKASLFKAVREKAAEEAALLDSIVRSYTDPASNPPPEPKSASAEEERRLPDLVFPVSLYTVRSTTDHLLEQKPGILAKRGVEGSWRKSTSVGWSVRVVGRSERGVVVSAQGVKSLEMYGEGDEDAVIYDEYDDGEDADLWREGAEGEEAWIWTCGVPMALPGELPRDRVLGVGQGGGERRRGGGLGGGPGGGGGCDARRHSANYYANPRAIETLIDFAYFHIPLSSDFVKFKVDTDEGYQVKGCVWRRGEYKARTYKWRDWAFRGAVGVQGLAKDDDDDDDDDDDEITFKTGKGVRLAKEKI